MIQVEGEEKDRAERAHPFLGGGGNGFGEAILCFCMASSKASRCFQHLETGCHSLLEKLQESLANFIVLEEDSSDLEGLLFGVDFHVSDLRDGLEELSL